MGRHDPLPQDFRERAESVQSNGRTPNFSGAEVLGGLVAFIRRYIALSYVQAVMVALWVMHTHAIDAADCTPYLHIKSAEKWSGKTRLLEVLALLVARRGGGRNGPPQRAQAPLNSRNHPRRGEGHPH